MEESSGRRRRIEEEKFAFDFVLELIRFVGCNTLSEKKKNTKTREPPYRFLLSVASIFIFLEFLFTSSFRSFVFRSVLFVCTNRGGLFRFTKRGKRNGFEERLENNRPALAAEVSAREEFEEGEPSFILALLYVG